MKSYTNIEQSKRLAEILSPESADMSWTNNKLKKEVSANLSSITELKAYYDRSIYDWDRFYELTPCWSLASLVNLMQIDCKIEKTALDLTSVFTYSIWSDYFNINTDEYDELVDACVEMIIKLHEQKLL